MVHHCHEMVCGSRQPARSYWKPHHRLLHQDSPDLLYILFTTDRLGQQLGEKLTVVDEQVIIPCESAEYEGSWSKTSLITAKMYGEVILNTYFDDLFVAEDSRPNLIAFRTTVHPPLGRYLQPYLPISRPKLGVQNDSVIVFHDGRRAVSIVCT